MQNSSPKVFSLLETMQDGREFESLIKNMSTIPQNYNPVEDIKCSISEVEMIRNHPCICYVANVVKHNPDSAITITDTLPFTEMVAAVPVEQKEVDIVLITPGGDAGQVDNFVHVLRPRFDKVNFIVIDMAMSAGTMFCLSGDEIVMPSWAKLGPIDPQIPNREGQLVPAQSILHALEIIRLRGEKQLKQHKPISWADVQILKNIDPKDIARATNASRYSSDMVKKFLVQYKFKSWNVHRDNRPVTQNEKEQRSQSISDLLCDHAVWKSHGNFIYRETLESRCKLKVEHAEDTPGLERSLRRMRALFFWLFENTPIIKFFISNHYCILKSANIPVRIATPQSKPIPTPQPK